MTFDAFESVDEANANIPMLFGYIKAGIDSIVVAVAERLARRKLLV